MHPRPMRSFVELSKRHLAGVSKDEAESRATRGKPENFARTMARVVLTRPLQVDLQDQLMRSFLELSKRCSAGA